MSKSKVINISGRNAPKISSIINNTQNHFSRVYIGEGSPKNSPNKDVKSDHWYRAKGGLKNVLKNCVGMACYYDMNTTRIHILPYVARDIKKLELHNEDQ